MKIKKPSWMSNHHLIPDNAMSFIRDIAVSAVVDRKRSPEEVSEVLGFSRSTIYSWLNRFAVDGYDGLESHQAPGAPSIITEDMDHWLKKTVLHFTPEDFGYQTPLWTCEILAQLLNATFKVNIASRTVNQHLTDLDLSYQKPAYRAREQKPAEVKQFLEDKFVRIQRLAEKIHADIGFEDEAGIDLRERSGKTWGKRGQTPEVEVTGRRGRLNVLSVVTAAGTLDYEITEENITGQHYLEFLKHLTEGREWPFIFIADRASFHHSKSVVEFVRQNRKKIRIYFLPAYSPDLNPDEHVWEEIKDKRLGRETVKTKSDLRRRLEVALNALKENTDRIKSFFLLPKTRYASL